jgi:hypothetical protein
MNILKSIGLEQVLHALSVVFQRLLHSETKRPRRAFLVDNYSAAPKRTFPPRRATDTWMQ